MVAAGTVTGAVGLRAGMTRFMKKLRALPCALLV
jgi:hypothetical protein